MSASVFNWSPGRGALLEHTELGFAIVDRDRRLIDCNEAYCRILGRSRASLLGRSTAEFCVPGDEDPGASATAALSSGTDCLSYEKRYLRGDGTTIWARLIVSVLSRQEGLYAGIVEDITERKETEAQYARTLAMLSEKTAFLERAQEVANVATYVADLRTRKVTLSAELAAIYGAGDQPLELDFDEYRGRFVHPDDLDHTVAVAESGYRSGAPVSWQRRIIRADGEVIWVATNSRVEYDETGRPVRSIGVVQDITDRARSLEELRASRQRIAEAAQRERSRLERDLHDGAQQRLVALSLQLRMLRSDIRSDPAQAEQLAALASDELAHSLEELRELARGIHPASLDHGLASALESLATRSCVATAVTCDVQAHVPRPVELAVYFVACEALANVGKYAEATAASLRLTRTPGGVAIEIADDGVGGADAARGSGLHGLADRVEALGGQLLVTSPPGAGTVITAELPCAS